MHAQQPTPCPLHASTRSVLQQLDSTFVDSTALNLQAEFRQAAPRGRKANARGTEIVLVFEDSECGRNDNGRKRILKDSTKRTTHPNQRTKTRQSITSAAPVRRSTIRQPLHTKPKNDSLEALTKEPRRRTIYVPSDNTTMLTIHPGARFASHDTVSIHTAAQNENVSPRERRAGRRSLAAPPKRAPLQQSLKVFQDVCSPKEFPGLPTGKENLPPGWDAIQRLTKGTKNLDEKVEKIRPQFQGARTIQRSASNLVSKKRSDSPIETRNQHKALCASSIRKFGANTYQNERRQQISVEVLKSSVTLMTSTVRIPKPFQYRLLQENIEHPQMFEETWMNNQETTITELINSLFDQAASERNDLFRLVDARRRMMELYQEPSMLALYQRLHASIRYGALRLPKENDSQNESSRFMNDVGIRQKFLQLWTKTYDLKLLRAALEVVTGREINSSSSSTSIGNTCELESFIRTCLLQNEDGFQAASMRGAPDSPSWSWRRTMQRSLMVICLLDRTMEKGVSCSNLFQCSSPYKTSTSVLIELGALLTPARGDLIRPLSHLDYRLNHSQHPLKEFSYPIQNLAVDLRDGVRLTRLVELLLPNANDVGAGAGSLSQRLKFPANSKAIRIGNVQMALGALNSVRGVSGMTDNTRAEEIVDGHREKTVVLLWGLVNDWGLPALIDWQDLEGEIWRLQNKSAAKEHHDMEKDGKAARSPTTNSQISRLEDWAEAIANAHDISVTNPTTSFADGRIFTCIIDEYLQYILPHATFPVDSPVSIKLKRLGCSTEFISMLGRLADERQFLNRDFTVATLSFLCSRLLGASRLARDQRAVLRKRAHDCARVIRIKTRVVGAAHIIQRAWRAHRAWKFCKEDADIWLAL